MKIFISGIFNIFLMFYMHPALSMDTQDLSWFDGCAGESAADSDFLLAWLEKMQVADPCDKETVKYLTEGELRTQISASLADLHRKADKKCRPRLRDLHLSVVNWKETFSELLDTHRCPASSEEVSSRYTINSQVGVYVRENPLLGKRSNSLGKLPPGQVLKLMRRVSGAEGELWGEFGYERNGEYRTGWISMRYVKAVH